MFRFYRQIFIQNIYKQCYIFYQNSNTFIICKIWNLYNSEKQKIKCDEYSVYNKIKNITFLNL